MPTGPKPRTLWQAFDYLKVNCRIDGECWLYEESTPIGIGYRVIRAGGQTWYIHHLAYFLFKKVIEEGHVHRHTCHKPNCFNPDHIIEGTQQQNIDDKVKAMRHSYGEVNWNSKLTEEQAREIKTSPENSGTLSRRFGVSRAAIQQCRNGFSWKHVKV